jgi:perosamine synthetase|tara:strand:- start:3728 stop:4771 length:1044 start_codon:yes stop_codon:yes gene_type:complete
MDNGKHVAAFEEAFADYVGARYAIAMANGTATLHTALAACGVKRGEPVAVPPLTMSATTIAVLHAGGVPTFVDIDPDTWLMDTTGGGSVGVPVSLYGLHYTVFDGDWDNIVDDAAQTLRPHDECADFTSYSFQASKILALGEGGMLVTNDEHLAREAREFSSLGYHMDPDQPRIDPAILKHPTYERHHSVGWNYRMSDWVARAGIHALHADDLVGDRRRAASYYREAIDACDWITPQHIPEGWTHDYWCYAIALEFPEMWDSFTAAVVKHGGEMPYGAWALTYFEPAFRHLGEHGQRPQGWFDPPGSGMCPVAEDLQPRLVQFQTNNLTSAQRNADAVAAAIKELNG